jgi:hypothetical protein
MHLHTRLAEYTKKQLAEPKQQGIADTRLFKKTEEVGRKQGIDFGSGNKLIPSRSGVAGREDDVGLKQSDVGRSAEESTEPGRVRGWV